MVKDQFLEDGWRLAPDEFRAWWDARERHHAVHSRAMAILDETPERHRLDAECVELGREIARLERIARQAFREKCSEQEREGFTAAIRRP